jgi:NAD(P)-dependent dehydrogenase (short-subunit alcohol dehydrogenase family)
VRVNSVCPGFIATDLALKSGFNEEALRQAIRAIPLKRQAKPEEVANCFSRIGRGFIVPGTVIVVDGGQICQQYKAR